MTDFISFVAFYHLMGDNNNDSYDFNKIYSDYTRQNGVMSDEFADIAFGPLIRTVETLLPEKSRIGEMGCSYGDFLLSLRRRGYNNTVGFESQKGPLETARRRGLDVQQINNYTGSHELKRKGPFDGIIANRVFEYPVMNRVDSEFLSKQIVRSLKSGGYLVLGSTEKERIYLYEFDRILKRVFCKNMPDESYVRALVTYRKQ
ncbi:MAG: methyltransferase domain-containing protein [Candidatus Aenigmarchaeota archaeon]|nr:methyltransferase domain-containing protein [Candidatus Aenigmarchaeota archaeon]